MVLEHRGEHPSQWAAIESIAGKIGCVPQTLYTWVRQHEVDNIETIETVLGGSEEALSNRSVDLAITHLVPSGFFGEPLLRLRFIAVAAPSHPLHALGRPVTHRDLRHHRQLVIRDSGTQRDRSAGWLGSDGRWTVTNKAMSIQAAIMGLGFAWYPEELVCEELAAGRLKALPMASGGSHFSDLHLVLTDPERAGPRTRQLAALLREAVADYRSCAEPQTDTP